MKDLAQPDALVAPLKKRRSRHDPPSSQPLMRIRRLLNNLKAVPHADVYADDGTEGMLTRVDAQLTDIDRDTRELVIVFADRGPSKVRMTVAAALLIRERLFYDNQTKLWITSK